MSYFSIVIPVFNTKLNQFKECIDSIIGCDLNLLKEIIVIDDGSEMNYHQSLNDAINTYNKPNLIRLIRLEENQGLANARKTGFINSEGEYLIFIDSDDIVIDNKFLNKLLYRFKTHRDIQFVKFNFLKFSVNKNIEYKNNNFLNDSLVYFNNSSLLGNGLWETSMVWQFAFKSDIFKKYPCLLNSINAYFEDIYFVSYLASLDLSCIKTDDKFIGYRINNKHSILDKAKFNQKNNSLSKITDIHKWFTSFDEYNLKSLQAFECWTAWCIIAILFNGYIKMKQHFTETPSKQQIKDFIKKYNYLKNLKLLRIALNLILINKILDKVVSFFISTVYKFK